MKKNDQKDELKELKAELKLLTKDHDKALKSIEEMTEEVKGLKADNKKLTRTVTLLNKKNGELTYDRDWHKVRYKEQKEYIKGYKANEEERMLIHQKLRDYDKRASLAKFNK